MPSATENFATWADGESLNGGGTGAFERHAAYAGNTAVTTNGTKRARSNHASAVNCVVHSFTPENADYDVSWDIIEVGTPSGSMEGGGPVGRADATANTMYYVRRGLNDPNTNAQLCKRVAGTETILGEAACALPAKVTLRMRGDQIEALRDGVTIIGPITDTAITAAGQAGLRHRRPNSDTNGYHFDNFEVIDASDVDGGVEGTSTVSGAGSVASSTSKGGEAAGAVSGAGALDAATQKNAFGVSVVSGAGTVTSAGEVGGGDARSGTSSVSAAGTATTAGQKNGQADSVVSAAGVVTSVGGVTRQAVLSISGEHFLINEAVTYQGRTAVNLESGQTAVDLEGLLMNARTINAVFDDDNAPTQANWDYPSGPAEPWDPDRNVAELVAMLPTYRAKGLLMLSVGLQGGNPASASAGGNGDPPSWIVSAFNSDGTLKQAWLDRLATVIEAADAEGMVVLVQLFYQRQDSRLTDETAINAAVDAITDWLVDTKAYTNVMLCIQNEVESSLWGTHAIFELARAHELVDRAKARHPSLIVGTGMRSDFLPSADVVSSSDYVAFSGNSHTVTEQETYIDNIRAMAAWTAEPKPILCIEDGPRPTAAKMDATLAKGVSFGYHDDGPAGGTFSDYNVGLQWVPVNYGLTTTEKQEFFDRVETYVISNDRSGSSSVSANGAVVASGAKQAAVTSAVSGGGAVVSTGTSAEARSGSSSVAGGGRLTAAAVKAGDGPSVLSGGGFASATGEKGAFAISLVTGGGTLTLEQLTARSAFSTVTGGGGVSTLAGEKPATLKLSDRAVAGVELGDRPAARVRLSDWPAGR